MHKFPRVLKSGLLHRGGALMTLLYVPCDVTRLCIALRPRGWHTSVVAPVSAPVALRLYLVSVLQVLRLRLSLTLLSLVVVP